MQRKNYFLKKSRNGMAMIMALVDEGLLDIDQPVKDYIEGFKLADPKSTEMVSLRQCCR